MKTIIKYLNSLNVRINNALVKHMPPRACERYDMEPKEWVNKYYDYLINDIAWK